MGPGASNRSAPQSLQLCNMELSSFRSWKMGMPPPSMFMFPVLEKGSPGWQSWREAYLPSKKCLHTLQRDRERTSNFSKAMLSATGGTFLPMFSTGRVKLLIVVSCNCLHVFRSPQVFAHAANLVVDQQPPRLPQKLSARSRVPPGEVSGYCSSPSTRPPGPSPRGPW